MDLKVAREILRNVGHAAIGEFIKKQPRVERLKSPQPAACWTEDGLVNYVVVDMFSGPESTFDTDSPLVLRLRVNQNPPIALERYLNHQRPAAKTIADRPFVSVNALPDQVSGLGGWMATFYQACRRADLTPPKPPTALIFCAVQPDLTEEHVDFKSLGRTWSECEQLWTPAAIEGFYPWFKGGTS
jgi:hypothetical protein